MLRGDDELASGEVQKRLLIGPHDDGPAILALTAWATVHGLTMLLIDGLAEIGPVSFLADRVGRAVLNGIRKR